jgi:hypothetical protein
MKIKLVFALILLSMLTSLVFTGRNRTFKNFSCRVVANRTLRKGTITNMDFHQDYKGDLWP